MTEDDRALAAVPGEVDLHATTDARVWAREFCRQAKAMGEIDEEWVFGWFANAIETARDAGRHAAEKDR